ncbi:MAG: uroporphyrinogen-III C-methyltransferase [Syntrophobacterales bacterium CG_4_8_14_3_um_filter_49_14]|nr:MAG: uroporphyrinogen-III C-methyltransferase [Syntrophobacterales bacterium CG23_combo_of_CG06-09_8_20_14_all_48_27]PJA50280.1 MAG: uroporphyrinogen-III C-methyltransferase [Syntrophobacterales bacterium CG_4_9_14_3_um_filter_49_8]PJC73087.1 MAG: uroporphyrinogen-III C-methyltransferase [Syntrophobacterales bacterium CG_4_8_14_3_um_filter_49_14]
MKKGKVYLIGAGPGDPGLITIRGVRCLQISDVIIYDHLVGKEILRHAKDTARLIYAGKEGGKHTLSQKEINQTLIEEAGHGHIVARLKGGDPFIFGRGGEEAQALARAGIPFEVIPGVTSAVAVPAYAGISLTHRGYTSSVAFVTGRQDPTGEERDIDWEALARVGTIVFLMGVKNLPHIVANLIKHGKDAATPAALIRWGTTADQETLACPLKDMGKKAEERHFSPPAILVVGQVVSLREDLNWFEKKPLFGKGIVITRPEAQAHEFAALLQEQGARVIYFSVIEIVPPEDLQYLDHAIEGLEKYQWIIFTSANGVDFFFARLRERGRDIRDLKGIRICAIGPATGDRIEKLGIRVDLVPETFISEGIVEAFFGLDVRGQRFLLPRAEQARDIIPQGLAKLGASVEVVTAYRTVNSGRKKEDLEELIKQGKVDVVTFTSPSTVTKFLETMGKGGGFVLPPNIKIACIGPVTENAVRKAGLSVDIMQEQYTIPGLVEAIADYFCKTGCGENI